MFVFKQMKRISSHSPHLSQTPWINCRNFLYKICNRKLHKSLQLQSQIKSYLISFKNNFRRKIFKMIRLTLICITLIVVVCSEPLNMDQFNNFRPIAEHYRARRQTTSTSNQTYTYGLGTPSASEYRNRTPTLFCINHNFSLSHLQLINWLDLRNTKMTLNQQISKFTQATCSTHWMASKSMLLRLPLSNWPQTQMQETNAPLLREELAKSSSD